MNHQSVHLISLITDLGYHSHVGEEDQVLTALADRGALDGVVWAHGSAYGQVRQDYNPAGGHDQGWIGYNAHKYLVDRLDRVFQCGAFEAPSGDGPVGRDVLAEGIADRDYQTMPVLRPGLITRNDLNHSPGWQVAGWRWLLTSFRFGAVATIHWPDKSKTKQTVARQPHGVDDGGLFTLNSLPGLPSLEELPETQRALRQTLVLAHAMDPDTAEFQLFLGRIRWNVDHGDAWAWRHDMLGRPPESGSRSTPPKPDAHVPPADPNISDIPLKLRRPAHGENRPRAIGEE